MMENRDTKYSDSVRVAIETLHKKDSVDSWDIAITQELFELFKNKIYDERRN
jgi:hypothetical protein